MSCAKPTLSLVSAVGKCGSLMMMSRKMSFVSVNETSVKGVRELVLNRPPVNSLNVELMQEIIHNMDELSSNNALQAVILKSSSPKVFCAGLDLSFVLSADAEGMRTLGRALHDLWRSIYTSRLAVISAINGPAIAGGCLIVSASDYRVAKETASVGLTESLLGIVGPWYLRETIVRLIGAKEAERMFILGQVFKTPDALRVGLVDESLGSSQEVDSRSLEVATKWASIPESGRVGSKLGLRAEVIEYAAKHRQEIEDWFVDGLTSQPVQKSIRLYFQGLKKSKV